MEGYQFTWERGRGTSNWIEVRLDRALVSSNFIQQFSEMKLTNLEVSTSDHAPILFEPVVVLKTNHVQHFRFKNAWLREPICQEIVKETWSRYAERSLQEKIRLCAEILSEWGKEITGSFKTRINQYKKTMRTMKSKRDSRSLQQYSEAAKQLTEVYNQQEVFWRQRSKQLWLREGDHNSKFFHSSTKARKKRNLITSLVDSQGNAMGWGTGLEETMENYFNELFTASNTDWTEVVRCIPERIKDDQNQMLLIDIEKQEVKQSLFSMHPDKSPGPDGMSPGFYQKFWHIVGEDVFQSVQ